MSLVRQTLQLTPQSPASLRRLAVAIDLLDPLARGLSLLHLRLVPALCVGSGARLLPTNVLKHLLLASRGLTRVVGRILALAPVLQFLFRLPVVTECKPRQNARQNDDQRVFHPPS